MIGNYSLWCVLWSCFFATVVARESILGSRDIGPTTFEREFNYQVSVQIHGHGHVCGGAIIDERFVLTAAQCLLNRTRQLTSRHISVLAGTDNLHETALPAMTRRVKEVFFPSEFHPTMEFKIGDIAVLKLIGSLRQEEMYFNRRRGKLLLQRHYWPPSHLTYFLGFGWQSFNISTGRGHSNGHLHYIDSMILDKHKCESHYPRGAIESDKQICLRNTMMQQLVYYNWWEGACTGDEGGAYVSRDGYVVAILSRIPRNCDDRLEPSIATYVPHYAASIINVMQHARDPLMISMLCA